MNPAHPIRRMPRPPPRGAALVAVLALGFAVAPVRTVRADDPPPEGGDTQSKIEAKMKEILRLMRENGQAILEASKGGVEKPKGVTVTPPDTPPGTTTPPPSGTPPPGGTEGGMAGGPAGTEPGVGGEIRRRMEEIVEQANKTGAAIPRELEELVRMIPKKKSSSSDGSGQPDSETRKPGEKPKPSDGDPKKGEKDDPKQGEHDPKNRDGDKPPPDGEKGRPRDDESPPWMAELPAEVRRNLLNADPEKVPPEYRDLLIRYQKWLLERAAKAKDGR